MRTTDEIRAILEGRGNTVDIVCEPWVDDGFVSFHRTGYPGVRAVVKVFKRVSGVHNDLVKRIAESERELDRCRKSKRSDSDS